MRTPRWAVLAVLAAVAVIAPTGCGEGVGGPRNVAPTTTTVVATPVTITRTGGIAGVNQSVEIAPDGSWVYTDKRTNVIERGTMAAAQRLELTRLTSQPAFYEQLFSLSPPPRCADAFHYQVAVGTRSAPVEDCGLNDRPAVAAVLAAIADATPL